VPVDFDWDDANIEHIAEHRLTPDEVEEAFFDAARVPSPAYTVGKERRRGVVCATSAGRLLIVITTRRGERIRVVTARDATESEQRQYRRRGK